MKLKFYYNFQLYDAIAQNQLVNVVMVEVIAESFEEATKKLKTPGLLPEGAIKHFRLHSIVEKGEDKK
jgi:hypothetical protein